MSKEIERVLAQGLAIVAKSIPDLIVWDAIKHSMKRRVKMNVKEKPISPKPNIKPTGYNPVTLKELDDAGETNIPIVVGTHISLEDMKHNFRTPLTAKRFMDHGGLMHDPNRPGRHPSSRDWNMPTIKCSRKTCVANYGGKCTMPSLIEIGPKGCKGFHKRASGKKK